MVETECAELFSPFCTCGTLLLRPWTGSWKARRVCPTYSLPGTNSGRPWKLIVGRRSFPKLGTKQICGYTFQGQTCSYSFNRCFFAFTNKKTKKWHKNLRLLKQNPHLDFMEAQKQDKQTNPICEPGSKPPARSEPIMMGLVIQCTECEFLEKKQQQKQLAVAGLCWFKIEQHLKILGKTMEFVPFFLATGNTWL